MTIFGLIKYTDLCKNCLKMCLQMLCLMTNNNMTSISVHHKFVNNTQDDIITDPTLTQTEQSNKIKFPAFIIIKARAKLVMFCGRHWWKPKKWKKKFKEIQSSQPIQIIGFYIIWKITALWILYMFKTRQFLRLYPP